MANSIFQRIEGKLHDLRITFDVFRHEPVFTSQEAADIRGVSLSSGAKALICKCDGSYRMYVLPADRKLASKQIRKLQGIKSLRFASQQEVLELTGLRPGSIPPFGSLFDLPTFCDRGLADEPRINFNAGDHAISVSMTYGDYMLAENPVMGDFGEPS